MTSAGETVRGEDIVALAHDLGFVLAGVCDAGPISTERATALRQWIANGTYGEMTYMANNTELRIDPRLLLDGARSIVMVADQYASRNDPPDALAPGTGRVARYARGDDYHVTMKKRLHALCDLLGERYPHSASRAFVDTAPVMEREHALRAGLGWIGKNTLLMHRRKGSYLFLGGLLTTLTITPPKRQSVSEDHCGTCTRCIDACPTSAITPYALDAKKCISYLTIEHRTAIDPEFHKAIGDWIYGCDICQEVCPHNSPRSGKIGIMRANPAYAPREALDAANGKGPDLLAMLNWTEDDRRALTRRSAMKRAKLDMLRRNAVIAASNARTPAIDARLREMANDKSEPGLVRGMAREVLADR